VQDIEASVNAGREASRRLQLTIHGEVSEPSK
jgi:hypothetical protein